jgi:hypothetical protein
MIELPDEETFYKAFGRLETPFGDFKNDKRYEFEYIPKSKAY